MTIAMFLLFVNSSLQTLRNSCICSLTRKKILGSCLRVGYNRRPSIFHIQHSLVHQMNTIHIMCPQILVKSDLCVSAETISIYLNKAIFPRDIQILSQFGLKNHKKMCRQIERLNIDYHFVITEANIWFFLFFQCFRGPPVPQGGILKPTWNAQSNAVLKACLCSTCCEKV